MTASESAPARLAGLDGLRAVAVIMVLVYHLFPGSPLRSGFVGVDVFFVISGFLITSLLMRPPRPGTTPGRRLVDFWRRRARRLLPALAIVVTVCATSAWIIGGDVLVGIGRQVLGAATFSYNWWAIGAGSDYFAATAPELFRNMWSLAVEEQFYLLWPLLLPVVLLIRPRWARSLLMLVAAAGSAAWMAIIVTGGDTTRAYFGTDSHAFGLFVGIALAFVVAGGRGRMPQTLVRRMTMPLGVVGVAAVVAAALLPETLDVRTFPFSLLLAAAGTALVILAGVVPGSWFGRALDVAPLRWIGDRSYGIYLWHWPVLVLVLAATQGTGPEGGVPPMVGVWVAAVTLVCAALSYRLVEQPVRRVGFRRAVRALWARLSGSPTTRFAALSALVVAALALGGTTAAVAGAPNTTTAEQMIAAGAEAVAAATPIPTATPRPAPTPSATPTPDPESVPREIPGDEITAIGDSVMLASAPSLYDAFPGISVDAEVSRSIWTGPEILQKLKDAGKLRPYVVVALGTNGPVDAEQLDAMRGIVGSERELILVNAHAPRKWIPGVNKTIAAYVAGHRHVTLADWTGAIGPHEDLLAGDRIHPGRKGGDIFARAVRSSLESIERTRIREAQQLEQAPSGRAPHVPFPAESVEG